MLEADVAHWHVVANETWRHRLYRDMEAKGLVIGKEPFLLLGPANKKPPRDVNGFYAGPLPPGKGRKDMWKKLCTTAEQLEAWEEAERVHEILNGVPVTTPRRWHLRFGSSSTLSMR